MGSKGTNEDLNPNLSYTRDGKCPSILHRGRAVGLETERQED